jgi:hypothetical protein
MTIFRFRTGNREGGPAPRPPMADSPRSIFGKMNAVSVAGAQFARFCPALALTGALFSGAAVAAQQIAVPSGVEFALYDVILEEDAGIARFRFVVPAIAPAGAHLEFADIVDDLQFVCDRVIVPALQGNGWSEAEIVLSISDQRADFGTYDPAITQFFQPFRLKDQTCIWEDF